MHASKRFWIFATVLLIVSCAFKGWQTDRNVLAYINDIALTRSVLDPALAAEKGPRILIAGGSNALSGYDSKLLSEATGIPTFNLALLSEGYDYRNTFQVIESRARAQDIVVLSTLRLSAAQQVNDAANISSYVIGNDSWWVPKQAPTLLLSSEAYLPPVAQLFADQTLIRLLANWSEQLRIGVISAREPQDGKQAHAGATAAGLHSSFARFEFDARGDWVNCTKAENPKPLAFDPALPEQAEEYLAALDQFAARLANRGITLRVTPATILVQPDAIELWREQHQALARSLRTAVMLPFDASKQLLTDRSKFCDTYAHLRRSQIATNNQAVVEAIKRLPNNQARVDVIKTFSNGKTG